MTDKKNIVASALARLRNTAKSSGAPFQQILQQYAIERFLYRISRSEHAQTVVLKGALLLKTIGIPHARPTMDIDMLRRGKADQASLIALVHDCATIDVEPDGLTLIAAIDATFENRGTPLPANEFTALSPTFVDDHQLQWNAFVRKIGADGLRDKFGEIVEDLQRFAMPLLRPRRG